MQYLLVDKRAAGEGRWRGAADRPAGKVMTSIHKVTAILDFVNLAELCRDFHLWFIVS